MKIRIKRSQLKKAVPPPLGCYTWRICEVGQNKAETSVRLNVEVAAGPQVGRGAMVWLRMDELPELLVAVRAVDLDCTEDDEDEVEADLVGLVFEAELSRDGKYYRLSQFSPDEIEDE
jgi:hypothetical protein